MASATTEIKSFPSRWAATEVLGDLETTFSGDFAIAEDISGAAGVKETFERAWNSWHREIDYVANLAYALNRKSWEHHEHGNAALCELYVELYEKVLDSVYGNEAAYTQDEINLFFRLTD